MDGTTLLELAESDFEKFFNEMRGEMVVLDVRSLNPVNPQQEKEEANKLGSETETGADAHREATKVPCAVEIDSSRFSRRDSVKEVIRTHKQGESLLRAASEGPFSESDRRCLVRIVVSELVSTTGTYYPPDSCKAALAQAIVEEFPLLKDNTNGCLGYEHYFDPSTRLGFIEYRLWTMRKGLTPEKKKYLSAALRRHRLTPGSTANNKKFNSHGLLTQETMIDKLNWMKQKMPIEANRLAIKSAMQQTAMNRHHWIETEKPSLSNIFEKYPRLLDFRGELIEQDFHLYWPGHEDNFLTKFPLKYVPKILGYAKRCRPDVLVKVKNLARDDNLKALVALYALLPVTNSKVKGKSRGKGRQEKKTSESPATSEAAGSLAEWCSADDASKPSPTLEDLIIILPESSTLPLEESEWRKYLKNSDQPLLMCIKGREKETCFVQGDGWFLTPALRSPIAAFDLLFKLKTLTNLPYPISLANFFSFLGVYIYETESNPCSTVSSLHINISNFKPDSGDSDY